MAGLSNTKGISAVRKKQYILLAGLTIVVAGVALLAGIMGTPARKAPPQRPVETTRKAFGAQGEIQDAAGVWRAEEGARIANVQTSPNCAPSLPNCRSCATRRRSARKTRPCVVRLS